MVLYALIATGRNVQFSINPFDADSAALRQSREKSKDVSHVSMGDSRNSTAITVRELSIASVDNNQISVVPVVFSDLEEPSQLPDPNVDDQLHPRGTHSEAHRTSSRSRRSAAPVHHLDSGLRFTQMTPSEFTSDLPPTYTPE